MTDDDSKKPQTRCMTHGYDPYLSEGAAFPPVFRSSTFLFKNAREGKRAFEIAYGLDERREGEIPALIYTRVNNPNVEMVEDRVTAWDGCEAAALFSSGMAAIASTCLAFLRPGDTLLFSNPVYGGSEALFRKMLPQFGIQTVEFPAECERDELERIARAQKNVRMIFMESPANPTILLTDLSAGRAVADALSMPDRPVLLAVDNTFMGPLFSRPKAFGADLVLYSATKFIGGHSDLVAGIAMGSAALVDQIKVIRTLLGAVADPQTAWLILRSLGTLEIRMRQQQQNARAIVEFLRVHPKIARVAYPGLEEMGVSQRARCERQCTGSGSLISFEIRGGEAEAFRVLDAVRAWKLAVSLGGIESLIEHPATMTHSDMTPEEQARAGITPAMIRLSVGLEDVEDLRADLERALAEI
ncbi:MAG: aminotransferase class I/II-fold pyridoxal phosphate-dependent enzyme [Myxococcales bacterium]|jgi:methionine-gamma-lyase|nr:aminotransferase class I/II-fold pyridoxal phosphate-dependent enzyme [Myxococcales bacterium]